MGIKQVLSAPRSPWQRAYVERLIGSIRRSAWIMSSFSANVLGIVRSYVSYCLKLAHSPCARKGRAAIPTNTVFRRR
jgi:transposase InsO family protein